MSDRIKNVLDTPKVPEELMPENIPDLIEARGVKRKKIKMTVFRAAAACAACAVITVGAVEFTQSRKYTESAVYTIAQNGAAAKGEAQCDTAEEYEGAEQSSVEAALVNPSDYEEMHGYLVKSMSSVIMGHGPDHVSEIPGGPMVNMEIRDGSFDTGADIYDTLSQVEGIAEADIIKTSEKGVYWLADNVLRYIPFDSETGKFGSVTVIDLAKESGLGEEYSITEIWEMYLDGDRLAVIAQVGCYDGGISPAGIFVFDVSGDSPCFTESSFQTGRYRSSRMKDGIMYLITTQGADYRLADDEKEYEKYIPCTGTSVSDMKCLPCDSIYIPRIWSDDIPFTYTNISAVDIRNTSESLSSVSVSGWTGEIYCTEDSIYTAGEDYSDFDSLTTVLTRFSIVNGKIEPAAYGKVNGWINDQFSMDEYNGFFRIATTSEDAETFDDENNVYVLDMNLNIVGSLTGFAPDESVKSVSFNGDTGYVVTYEQTDPLFAIDLSDPYNPVITDELKITGYSSFLRKWNDDLLFGFGTEANENGVETGVKLVMFDVSDDGELKECGYYSISGDRYGKYISEAVYDRKALLFSPERNLIGFPLYDGTAHMMYSETSDGIYSDDIDGLKDSSNIRPLPELTYRIFSYENGSFTEKASVAASDSGYGRDFRRGTYNGNYMCIFSDEECVSIDLNDFNEKDRVKFN